MAKEIYMAAKGGVPDPEMNLNLKRVIDRAKVARFRLILLKEISKGLKEAILKPTWKIDMKVLALQVQRLLLIP